MTSGVRPGQQSGKRYDLVLRGGSVVNHDSVRRADIAVRDGVVVAVGDLGADVSAADTIDVAGKHLFPGAIDPHIHMTTNTMNEGIGDSLARESRSLALGGTTTAFDFLGNVDQSYLEHGPFVIEQIEKRSYVDVALHAMLNTEQQVREIERCASEIGLTSFKMFFSNRGSQQIYARTRSIEDGLVYRALTNIARLGPRGTALFHAENWEVPRQLRAELEAAGRTDPAAWTESRPNFCEVDGMQQVARFAADTGARVYAVHLSTREAPSILRESRGRGIDFYGETCPHYLSVHKDDPRAKLAKYNPAIKRSEDVEALWEAVIDGTIDCMGTDHIAVRLKDKDLDKNIWECRAGVPGSGTILPFLISEGHSRRGLSLERVAAMASYNAARIFGLYPRKGAIAIGSDADIVVSKLDRTVTVKPEMLDLDFTLFDGQEFTGWPEMTIQRGNILARDGKLLAKEGQGRYIPAA